MTLNRDCRSSTARKKPQKGKREKKRKTFLVRLKVQKKVENFSNRKKKDRFIFETFLKVLETKIKNPSLFLGTLNL